MFRHLKTLLTNQTPSLLTTLSKRTSKRLLINSVLKPAQSRVQFQHSFRFFSTSSSKNDGLIEDILNDLQNEDVEHSEEPFVICHMFLSYIYFDRFQMKIWIR